MTIKKCIIYFSILITCFISLIMKSSAIQGIDVSRYQGYIDYSRVRSSGIEIVYIRSSLGNSYVDPYFRQNYNNAKSNGLKVGFYHYVVARNTTEAKEEARFFASTIAGLQPDCLLAMDFEQLNGLSSYEVSQISLAFLQELESLTNKKAVVYSDSYNANNMFDRTISSRYPLWIAEYGVERPNTGNWPNWIGWQYTDKGEIPGINGYVDRDTFTNNIFLNDTTPIDDPDVRDEDSTKAIYYRIKRGDTLYAIAREYGVTVSNIVSWNNIQNPNLIYPNQVLTIYTHFKKQITNTTTQETTYTVKRGDTLWAIARKYNVTVENLVTWNNISNANLIYPGEVLKINPTNNAHLIKYVVVSGDTLDSIASRYNTSVYELTKLNNISNPNYLYIGEVIYIPQTYIY